MSKLMNKKKLFLIPLALLFLYLASFWWLKPLIDINKVGFSEVPTVTPVAPKIILEFSVIGDPESDLGNLKKALEISKNNNDEFTILVGDLTQAGTKKQLLDVKKVLDESSLKYYVIPGNHDLYSSRKQAGDPRRYFEDFFGKPYYQVLIKNIQFLFLDNSDEYQLMGDEQIAFIKANLGDNFTLLTFVFLHIPIFHPSSDYIMGYQNPELGKQKDELLSIFSQAGVSGIFSGHLHKTSSYDWQGIKMYIAGSVNSVRNWQTPRFLEVKVFKDSSFQVKEIEL